MQVLVSAFYFGYADGLSCVDGVKPGPSFSKKAYASILVQSLCNGTLFHHRCAWSWLYLWPDGMRVKQQPQWTLGAWGYCILAK
jgi:hypothetical protein